MHLGVFTMRVVLAAIGISLFGMAVTTSGANA